MQIKTKIVSCHTTNSKLVKQEVNGTVILHLLVFLAATNVHSSKWIFFQLIYLEQSTFLRYLWLDGVAMRPIHRYQKAKIDCLSFVMCPLLEQLIIAFFFLFFAAAVYSTISANKAGGTRR